MQNSILPKTCLFLTLALGGSLAGMSLAPAVPLIFNSTETAAPGEVIYLQGDNFGSSPQAVFCLVAGSALSQPPAAPSALAPSSPYKAMTTSTASTSMMTATLPNNIPMGLYAIWLYDGNNYTTTPVFINRARATSFEFNAVSPGYAFRIFGRNLFLKGLPAGSPLPTVNFVYGANTYPATVVQSYPNDGNVLQVTAPTGIATGINYSVQVSNSAGSGSGYDVTTALATIQGRTGGGDPFNLGVPWGADFTSIAADKIDVTAALNPRTHQPYSAGLISGANGSDWTNAIQQALYDAGNTAYHPNGATVYIPAGTYNINYNNEAAQFYGPSVYNSVTQTYAPCSTQITQNAPNLSGHWELEIPSRVVLQGAGIGNTILDDGSPGTSGYVFFLTIADVSPNFGSLSGVQGFTCVQTNTPTSAVHSPAIRNYAEHSSEIFFDHIQIDFANGLFPSVNPTSAALGQFIPQSIDDSNVLMQYCNIGHLTFGDGNYYALGFGHNYLIRNNTISSWVGRLEFLYMTNLLAENNQFYRDALFPPNDASLLPYLIGCGGIETSGPDQTILGNTFGAINVDSTHTISYNNDGETILCQATAPYAGSINPTDRGTVTTTLNTGATTITDSTKTWVTNAYTGLQLILTSGPENGPLVQTETITSNTATTLTFSPALNRQTLNGSVIYSVFQTNPLIPDSGTAGTITVNSLQDLSKSWRLNGFEGLILMITSGTCQGEWAQITSNTLNTDPKNPSTISIVSWQGGNPTTTPPSGSGYAIQQSNSYVLSTVTSATTTTLTDTSRDSGGNSWPTNFHVGDTVAIVNGSGTGQISTITSNTADTLTFSPAFAEVPANGAEYSISGTLNRAPQRWLVKNNNLYQVPRGIIFGSGGYDNAIVGNTLDSAGGIFLDALERDYLVAINTGVSIPYYRNDLAWKNVITDNFVSDTYQYGHYAPYFAVHDDTSGPIKGSIVLGVENRRNILWSSEILPNPWDPGFSCDESFATILSQSPTGSISSSISGALGSVYTDNVSLFSDIAYEVTSGDSQTVIADSLQQNCGSANNLNSTNSDLIKYKGATLPPGDVDDIYGDFLLPGDSFSNQTEVGATVGGKIMDANFSGVGTNTGLGGTGSNLVDVGAAGQLVATVGGGVQTATILNTTPLDSGSGSYMEVNWTGAGGNSGVGLKSTAVSQRFSWARIFDQRTGMWLVNGAFDFFARPAQNCVTSWDMYPILIGLPGTNSLRMDFGFYQGNHLELALETPSGGGGNTVIGTFTPGFTAGTAYHMGVTFSTDASQSPPLTTVKIYAVAGTGAIDTTSTANLIGSGTIALNHAVVNDNSSTSWFNGGAWVFGGGPGPTGKADTTDYDRFRLYYADPGTFPALDALP